MDFGPAAAKNENNEDYTMYKQNKCDEIQVMAIVETKQDRGKYFLVGILNNHSQCPSAIFFQNNSEFEICFHVNSDQTFKWNSLNIYNICKQGLSQTPRHKLGLQFQILENMTYYS